MDVPHYVAQDYRPTIKQSLIVINDDYPCLGLVLGKNDVYKYGLYNKDLSDWILIDISFSHYMTLINNSNTKILDNMTETAFNDGYKKFINGSSLSNAKYQLYKQKSREQLATELF